MYFSAKFSGGADLVVKGADSYGTENAINRDSIAFLNFELFLINWVSILDSNSASN